MAPIHCHVPITLRLPAHPSEQALAELEERLVALLSARVAHAHRTILAGRAAHPPDRVRADGAERYDASREGSAGATYEVPSYDGGGRPASVTLRRPRQRARWEVRKAVTIRLPLRRFIEFLERLDPRSGDAAALRALYPERYDELRAVAVWLVRATEPIAIDTLVTEVAERYRALVAPGREFFFGFTVHEQDRQYLMMLAEGGRLAELPDMSYNPGGMLGGRAFLRRGGMVLFVETSLPAVTAEEVAVLYGSVDVSLPTRDLAFIVSGQAFERLFDTPWGSYLAEFGDQPATLRMLPFFTLGRVHHDTLKYLVEPRISSSVPSDAAYFGNLYLLVRSRVDWLPPAGRDAIAPYLDDVTLGLDEAQRFGYWERNWAGAFICAVLQPTAAQQDAARFRPEARRVADELAPLLRRDPRRFPWAWDLLDFFQSRYRDPRPNRPAPRAMAFEFLLAELEARALFDRLFQAVEQAENGSLHHFLIQAALATRYAGHPRVRQTVELFNARRRGYLTHTYRVADGEIWLRHDPGVRLRVGQVVADVDSIFSAEREIQQVKPARQQELREAVEAEARALLSRIVSGEDTKQYDEKQFAEAVVAAAAQRINLGEDDLEEITIERSMRLLGLQSHFDAGVEYFYVTYDMVERVEGGAWVPVQDSRRFERDAEFEWLLWGWAYTKQAAVAQAFAIGVTIFAVLVIAWEVGAIALLLELAGGATVVAISIGISELIYLLRVIFGDARLTLEGFLFAALDGYLMALGFRGAALLGRGAAGLIGTASIRRIVTGWVLERLVVGTVGGAGSAALTTFTHDLIRVLAGRGGWTSPEDYVSHMAWGAVLGVVFEFGIGALQPVLRATGRSALETLEQIVQRIRAEGITLPQWSAATVEALSAFRQRLATVLEPGVADRFIAAFRQRLGQVSESLSVRVRQSVFRRVLELSEVPMTRAASQGLEKVLTTALPHLDDEAALRLFNSLKAHPETALPFLEAASAVDDALLAAVTRGRQIEQLASNPNVLRLIHVDPVVANLIRATAEMPAAQAAARVGGIVRLVQRGPAVPETFTRGAVVARGGTSELYEVAEHPEFLAKVGGGRLPREAEGLVELELLGIETVYAGTRRIDGQTNIVVRRIDGVGSKDIIGRTKSPLVPAQHTEVVTQRTIDDLERIYQTLDRSHTNVGDFQFIVRRSDGAVFVNDPVSVHPGSPSGSVRGIIDRFRAILRARTAGGGGG
jgi:hypothetical protein